MKSRALVIVSYGLIVAIAVARVASTWRVFSATNDEPMHLICGLDWWAGRPYTAQPDNPPLPRVLAALPFAMGGAHAPASGDNVPRGNAVLYSEGGYVRNLVRARAGNMLFLVLGILAVGAWGSRRFGPATGVASAFFFGWLPPVRAHAGLATTDMAAAATFALAVVVLERWMDRPTVGRGAAVGAAIAAGLLSKLSFLPFFLLAAGTIVGVRLWRSDLRFRGTSAGAAAVVLGVGVWAGYRFDVGRLDRVFPTTPDLLAAVVPRPVLPAALSVAANVPLPAPMFFSGAALLAAENRQGHEGYLLGNIRARGWWYYFPVALFFKTPLPFLVLAAVGVGMAARARRRQIDIVLMPVAMLVSVLPASIDIGVRHLLPLYVPLSVAAAHGAVVLVKRAEWRLAAAGLIAWLVIGTETAHPDYLPWFNEAAGAHPERILGDSNLDWGQDGLRLADRMNRPGIDRMAILFSGTIELENHLGNRRRIGRALLPGDRGPGWYALSEQALAMSAEARRGAYAWLDDYALTRIGKSIRLYHVPR